MDMAARTRGVVTITMLGIGEPFHCGTFFSDGTGWIPLGRSDHDLSYDTVVNGA